MTRNCEPKCTRLCAALALAGVWALSATAQAKARFTTIDPSGSISTTAIAINDGGVIAGYYEDGSGRTHGYVRGADGTITTFDPPRSRYTEALAINTAGAITGFYLPHDSENRGNKGIGFVRAPDGTITRRLPRDQVTSRALASMIKA